MINAALTCRIYPYRCARLFLFSLFILFAPGFIHADALRCADPGSTLLWELRGKKSTVHLFGSVHLGAASFYPLPEAIESAFHTADYVVFELDPRTLLDPATQMQMLQAGRLPSGQRLNEVLSEKTLSQLRLVLADTGMSLNNLINFRPWFVSTLLATFQFASLGYSPEYGVERYLISQLKSEHEVLSLETLEQQLSALQQLDGDAFLAQSLKDFERGAELAEQLVAAWRCADKEALISLLHPSLDTEDDELRAKWPAIHAQLFTERNIRMAQQIDHYLREGEGRYFVVTGSGHLLGKDSIVELLRARGHAVNTVRLHEDN